MTLRAAVVALSGVVLLACSTPREHGVASLADLGERLAHTICPGPPTEVEPVRNQHEPSQMDRLETRRCSAGTSTIYTGRTTSRTDGLPVFLEVRAAAIGLPVHLQIGQPFERAARYLGEPLEERDGSAIYALSWDSDSTVTVHHAAGKVMSLQWSWVED